MLITRLKIKIPRYIVNNRRPTIQIKLNYIHNILLVNIILIFIKLLLTEIKFWVNSLVPPLY